MKAKMATRLCPQVFIKRDTDKVSMVVDGISAQSRKIPAGERTRISAPLFVGGVPQQSPMSDAHSGFTGCVRDLTLNESPAGSPAHSQGVVPCFQKPVQPGAFFTGGGGHVVVGEQLFCHHRFLHYRVMMMM